MPNDPIRLQVIDRIVQILKSIQEGDDYFYSPRAVTKGFIANPQAYPVYEVLSDSGGEIVYAGREEYDETFYVRINGTVQDTGDVVTKLERALRDVRKAINDDSVSTASGTLGGMSTVVQVRIDDPAEIDYGLEASNFFGFFSQRVRVHITGNYGEL